jgi:hypothetical protein
MQDQGAEAMVRKYMASTKGKAPKWGNKPDWWYGVIDRKAGSDICALWEEAGSNYLGISGARVKKLCLYEDMEVFIGWNARCCMQEKVCNVVAV